MQIVQLRVLKRGKTSTLTLGATDHSAEYGKHVAYARVKRGSALAGHARLPRQIMASVQAQAGTSIELVF